MHLLCIFEPQISHFQILATIESHSLHNITNFPSKYKSVSSKTEYPASPCKEVGQIKLYGLNFEEYYLTFGLGSSLHGCESKE